ncbi:MAG TPA: 30S ribosomal protein S6 [Firmicutes bacterium]|nr:30S ribosomal protein S6 [Bacillota bacterium]
MRNYEAMIILQPDLDEENRKVLEDKVKEIVEKIGGEVTEINNWGLRKLAYEINNFREGYYLLVKFKEEGKSIAELEKILQITEGIIRYLVVREGD